MKTKALAALLATISEKREALNQYLADTKPDQVKADKVTELRGALNDSERKMREAIAAAENAEDDGKESRELVDRIDLRNYMQAAIKGGAVEGAEKELNEERGLPLESSIPWDALLPMADEERADTVVATPADDAIAKPAQSVLRRLFKRTRVAYLGMRMPSVATGEPVYPIMLTGANEAGLAAAGDPGGRAKGATIDSSTATFTSKTISPTRLSARYVWAIEDATRFPLESLLREDLRTVMGLLLDHQVLNGSGATGNIDGLMRNDAAGPLGVDKKTSEKLAYSGAGSPIHEWYDFVDGLAVETAAGVRTLIGLDTYKAMAVIIHPDTGETALELLSRLQLSYAVSAIIADKSATAGADTLNTQQAVQTRNGTDGVIPVWEGITMIRDPYSGAAKGEVALTAVMLANFELLRAEHFRKTVFNLTA